MFEMFDPNSVKNLRKRASKLPICPYKLILELAADQLEANKVSKQEVAKAIEYTRTGNPNLLSAAIKLLNPNQGQISAALCFLEKM